MFPGVLKRHHKVEMVIKKKCDDLNLLLAHRRWNSIIVLESTPGALFRPSRGVLVGVPISTTIASLVVPLTSLLLLHFIRVEGGILVLLLVLRVLAGRVGVVV